MNILEGVPEEKLTVEQETALHAAGDFDALVSHTLREAFYYAKGCYQSASLSEGEVLSAVYAGLTGAVKNFQKGRIRFFAYSKPYVRGALSRATTANCLVPTVYKTEELPIEDHEEDEESSYVPTKRPGGSAETPEIEALCLKEEWLQLRPVLMEVLDEKERIIIELSYIGGLILQEIADLLGVTRSDVHHCRMEALRKVRNRLI